MAASVRLRSLRYEGTCRVCSRSLAKGTRAYWDPDAHTVTCEGCVSEAAALVPAVPPPPTPAKFVPGASAEAIAERRSARNGAKTNGSSKHDSSRSWRSGAVVERKVGALLNHLQGLGAIKAI